MIIARASIQDTQSLAKYAFDKGYSSDQVVEWLKSKKYIVKGKRFDVARVASAVQARTDLQIELLLVAKQTLTAKQFEKLTNALKG